MTSRVLRTPLRRLLTARPRLYLSSLIGIAVGAEAYAYEYFGPRRHKGIPPALAFPDDVQPDYWDLMYFAMCIGMPCQVSDVAIRSRVLRRVATIHAMLAFFYNTIVLALTVN